MPEAFARFEDFLAEANAIDHELRCLDEALAFVAEVRDAERRRQKVEEQWESAVWEGNKTPEIAGVAGK